MSRPPPGCALETPLDAPFLAHWRGAFDRAFVILHPFTAPTGETTSHAVIAAEAEAPSFATFEIALMLAAYGMSADERRRDVRPVVDDGHVSRIRSAVTRRALDYPADDVLALHVQRQAAEILAELGADHALTWSRFRSDRAEIGLDALAGGAAGWPVAIADPDHRVLFDCDFCAMDRLWSVVAWRASADDAVRPARRFEGFEAGARTTPNWPNRPGSYAPPAGWPR